MICKFYKIYRYNCKKMLKVLFVNVGVDCLIYVGVVLMLI